MTQQIRDEIAKLRGWTKNKDLGNPCDWIPLDAWTRGDPGNDGEHQLAHPIPDTLDAAVSVIEGEGFGWTIHRKVGTNLETWVAFDIHNRNIKDCRVIRTADNLLDLMQLALACIKQSRPTRQEGTHDGPPMQPTHHHGR
jgi:hypothetical protein